MERERAKISLPGFCLGERERVNTCRVLTSSLSGSIPAKRYRISCRVTTCTRLESTTTRNASGFGAIFVNRNESLNTSRYLLMPQTPRKSVLIRDGGEYVCVCFQVRRGRRRQRQQVGRKVRNGIVVILYPFSPAATAGEVEIQ